MRGRRAAKGLTTVSEEQDQEDVNPNPNAAAGAAAANGRPMRARGLSNRDTASRSSGSSQGAGGVKRSSKELGEDAEAEAAKRAKDETLVVTRDQLAVEMEHQKALAASNLAEKLAEKTVQALKKELKKAGLDDKGTKPQLLKRLQAHLEAGGGGAAEAAAEAEPMAVEEEKPAAAPEEVEMEEAAAPDAEAAEAAPADGDGDAAAAASAAAADT